MRKIIISLVVVIVFCGLVSRSLVGNVVSAEEVLSVEATFQAISKLSERDTLLMKRGSKLSNDLQNLHLVLKTRDAKRHKRDIMAKFDKIEKGFCSIKKEIQATIEYTQKSFSGPDIYIGDYARELEKLPDTIDWCEDMIRSVRMNMVAYLNLECQSRLTGCHYIPLVDLRLIEVRLLHSLVQLKKAFIKVLSPSVFD